MIECDDKYTLVSVIACKRIVQTVLGNGMAFVAPLSGTAHLVSCNGIKQGSSMSITFTDAESEPACCIICN